MKFLTIVLAAFATGVLAQSDPDPSDFEDGCGFPDGPDCVSVGFDDDGVEQLTEPEGSDDGCCLLPARCGNDSSIVRCVRV